MVKSLHFPCEGLKYGPSLENYNLTGCIRPAKMKKKEPWMATSEFSWVHPKQLSLVRTTYLCFLVKISFEEKIFLPDTSIY